MTMAHHAHEEPSVLLVDDDEVVLQAHAQVLMSEGFRVETVTDGAAALRALRWAPFDIVLSEIDMRGMNGIQLLERIRTAEPEVPVILLSNIASVPVMDLALEQGALRCLIKPVEPHILAKVVECTVRHQRLKRAKRRPAPAGASARTPAASRRTLVAAFDHALESLYLAFQPIVSWSNQRVVGYQALLRSEEPIMKDARSILDAAERTGRLHHLGRQIRAAARESMTRLRPDAPLFVHIHPSDLFDEEMFAVDAPLMSVASQVVLEIAERDYLRGIKGVEGRVATLRRPGFRLAIGEVGAGRAGLSTFGLLDPDFVKLDVAVVRGLHVHPENRALVRKISAMCRELDLALIGEGIENRDERDELARMGCDLMQGHLFAPPAPALPLPAF